MNELFNLFIVIILAGVILGVINALIPMARVIRSLLNIFAAIVIILYILQFFNLIPVVIPMPRVI